MAPKPGPSGQASQARNATKTDKDPVKDHLAAILGAQDNLEKALDQPSLQGPEAGEPEVDEKKLAAELKKLEGELKRHDEVRTKLVDKIKDKHHHELKDKVISDRNEHIKRTIGEEIGKQAREQVGAQVSEFLPVTLGEQLQDAEKYLAKMKKALENSQARLTNGGINVKETTDWNRPLKEVLKDDGTRSIFYPQDLATLYHYREEAMKGLLADFGLNFDQSGDSRKENFNRFIQYIGVRERFVGTMVG